ncbi:MULTISPECIES: NAD(P)H-hydrate dehydratase [unclassified Arenibacter]|uniref:NAD(P)H-hydrate dehydratase n=1 Tax=unclassified Arenibacter TaxID=2615047 RepID=UPI000E3414B3|nr:MULTISPECIES: NAD(P)H-hydrate dehydratase [unclassified Arenibacter]MCM4165150.1 bifunctional ADP-dependent NAD(P)H-hydrate dehydratase/NAD(P)H-hydrate epimerase [Arenibacter sp. A80]RFT55014.1 NAD(P)H-hydrate dehydratase [Arenibacter sp. P308M17]
MKIFNAKQIYEADKFTMIKQGISSEQLMERAAIRIFNWMHSRMQGTQLKIHLFCGIGNNGGDGLALARHLLDHDYNIEVFVVDYSEHRSKDFLINLDRLKEKGIWPNFINEQSDFPDIGKEDIIVDAIFGIGLNRVPDKWLIGLMRHLNSSKAFILAIDVPSGLYMDAGLPNKDGVIKANYVLTFQVPKLVFFLPETGRYIDHWEVLDIGLDKDFLVGLKTEYELIGKGEVLPMYKPREKFSHKGSYGHSLIIGGSYGKMGAVVLAAKGSMLAGSGLVTAYVPRCGYGPLQTALPEAMVITDNEEGEISKIDFDIVPSVIGIGVGMETTGTTSKAFSNFLMNNKLPLVIDADGLNILSKNKGLLGKLPPQTVLTPHPKELERILGKWTDDFDKLKKAKRFSEKYDCILVIKGANTITVYKDTGYVNTTGNPGMATGGSGDVLTGIITGLIAQGHSPLNAAIFGVYLHGKAADIAVENCSFQALIASGILDNIGRAYLDLFQISEPDVASGEGNQ